jgi:hypothetical protein
MNKPPNPTDILVWQLRGTLFGLLIALALFLVPAVAIRSGDLILAGCFLLIALPILGFVLGTFWGTRPRPDENGGRSVRPTRRPRPPAST